MNVLSSRIAAVLAALALLGLTSCSGPVVGKVGTPEFYWAAARETFAAGDYQKTTEHLDHLIGGHNEYTALAIPWSLVLTSGMAAGYMELADNYAAGARYAKGNGLAFRRKATEYRTMANPLVLEFAQDVDKLDQLRTGAIPLAFPLPKGTLTEPPLLARVAGGFELTPAETETVLAQTIERNVLLSVCQAAGAPNDTAKAQDILGKASANALTSTFAKALSQMMNRETSLYARDQLDNPEKMAILRQRAQKLLNDAAPAGEAMVVKVQAKAQ